MMGKDDGARELDSQLNKLEMDLSGGLRFTNLLASSNQEETRENMVLLHSLTELLVSKGFIHVHELEKRKEMLLESLKQSEEQKPQIHLLDAPDKYAEEHKVAVNCAEHHPACKGACCSLWFALSVQDLNEGIVKWDYAHPYGIAQSKDGFCVHFNRDDYTCGVHENKPLVCRSYDCSKDQRIWQDFEKKIINPEMQTRLLEKSKENS